MQTVDENDKSRVPLIISPYFLFYLKFLPLSANLYIVFLTVSDVQEVHHSSLIPHLPIFVGCCSVEDAESLANQQQENMPTIKESSVLTVG